jgi:hypothetical protein
MISLKRAGIAAIALAAVVGMGALGTTTAHAADGTSSDFGLGYVGKGLVHGVASCDTSTGKVNIAWTFTYTTDIPTMLLTVNSATAGGLTGTASIAAPVTPAANRTVTISGTSTGHTAGTTVTQVVGYTVARVDVPGSFVSSVPGTTVDTGTCVVIVPPPAPTTTTTVAETTTTAAAVVTTAAAVVTTATTAKATTTTAKATVLGTTALPATGRNTDTLVAFAFAFGIIGVTLLTIDDRKKRAQAKV